MDYQMLININKHKTWMMLNFPGLIMLILLAWNPILRKIIVFYSAYTALGLIILVLELNPLQSIFKTNNLIKKFNRYRRSIGVASFSYAFIHFICFIIKRGSIKATLPFLYKHPGIIIGFIALIILLILAISSNNFSVKKLGFKPWKNLHKMIYVGEILIFIHMIIFKQILWAIILILPLITLQLVSKYSNSLKR